MRQAGGTQGIMGGGGGPDAGRPRRAAGGMDARIAASDSETLQAMAGGYYGMEVVRGLEIEVVG